jgi:hypothetical protein
MRPRARHMQNAVVSFVLTARRAFSGKAIGGGC